MFVGGVGQSQQTTSTGAVAAIMSKTQKISTLNAVEIKGEKMISDSSGGGEIVPRDIELMKAQIQIENYKMKLLKLQKDQELQSTSH